jgi:hypothetical protein
MLALIIPLTIAAIAQGFVLAAVGIVPLFWIFGGAIGTVGLGLLYMLDIDTSAAKWIGYQVLVGFIFGWTWQCALSNAQVQASNEDMSQVNAIINFAMAIGGSFLLAAAQCGFNNQLIKTVVTRLPGVDPMVALGTGATQIRNAFTAEQIPIVLEGYISGLRAVWAVGIAAVGLCTFIGFFGSWKKLQPADLKAAAGGAA